jgi:hypothetical protein
MIEILSVVLLAWLLDFAKLSWHGMRPGLMWMVIHFVSAWFLLGIACESFLTGNMTLVVTTAFVAGHFYLIDAKRNGLWYGKLFSWLSSWPFQIAAAISLGWHALYVLPLIGVGNLLMWIDFLRIYTANEKYRLRPKHWDESYWERYM